MGKVAWQVLAAISTSAAMMLGALAWNTSRALEVANEELRDGTLVPVYSIRIPGKKLSRLAGYDHCVDGVVYMKVDGRLLATDDNGESFGNCEMAPLRETQ